MLLEARLATKKNTLCGLPCPDGSECPLGVGGPVGQVGEEVVVGVCDPALAHGSAPADEVVHVVAQRSIRQPGKVKGFSSFT